ATDNSTVPTRSCREATDAGCGGVVLAATASIISAGTSTNPPSWSPSAGVRCCARQADNVGTGRSFSRQNWLSVCPLASNSATHSARSSGVQRQRVWGLAEVAVSIPHARHLPSTTASLYSVGHLPFLLA